MDQQNQPHRDYRFFCTQCGRCCRYEEGFVFISRKDLQELARQLSMQEAEVIDTYCRWVPFGAVDHLSLREHPNCDCIFWRDGGCSVYPARPLQCRTYPFWSHIVEDPRGWKEESCVCPGIGAGPRYSGDTVELLLAERRGAVVLMRRTATGLVE